MNGEIGNRKSEIGVYFEDRSLSSMEVRGKWVLIYVLPPAVSTCLALSPRNTGDSTKQVHDERSTETN